MAKLGTGIYRSENGGATWKYVNRMNNRPFYYSHIYINPLEDKWVYFLATNMSFSNDGGKTWNQVGSLHPDFHTMWLDPTNKNRMYVGQDGDASISHDNGNAQVTRNGGVSWTNVRENIKGVPPAIWCSRVEASRFDEGTAYVAFDGHRSDDYHVYVYKTTDYGKTWTVITNGIPGGCASNGADMDGETSSTRARIRPSALRFTSISKPNRIRWRRSKSRTPPANRKQPNLFNDAEPGITRILWDFQFDPPAVTIQNAAANLKKQLDAASPRTDLTPEQKTTVKEAMKRFEAAGGSYRKIQEIQRSVMNIIPGRGMGQFQGGGRMGGGRDLRRQTDGQREKDDR